jgi:hypothetical protein
VTDKDGGPSVSAMMPFVAATSSSIDVRGICRATTGKSLDPVER